jgi:hypothetical protein
VFGTPEVWGACASKYLWVMIIGDFCIQ